MNLIRIGLEMYNLSLLIHAEFTQAQKGVGAAKLKMRFAAPESEARTNYDGDYVGCEEARPYCRTLRGAEAEQAWEILRRMESR